MLERLPLGVYLPGTSPIHTLRARTKLLLLAWMALLFFVANHFPFRFGVYGVSFALLLLTMVLTHISPAYLWRRMWLIVLLLLIGLPITIFTTTGKTWRTLGPWTLSFGGITAHVEIVITYDGLWFAFSLTAIFLLLFVGSLLLTLTTSPVALAEGVVLLLRPLRRFGVPADAFGLMTLVCLRFFPVLIDETEQLLKAQLSRGADFSTGPLSARLRAAGTLLVPLVQGALRRAEDLATALDARGYGVGGEATLLHEGPLQRQDWLVLVGVPLVTLAALLA